MSSKDPDPVVTSYKYKAGFHFIIAWGRGCYELLKTRVGEKIFDTTATSGSVDQPNLFGGDAREGGVVGDYDYLDGNSSQVVNTYLDAQITGLLPAYRNRASFVWKGGQYASGNPYPKPWSFLLKRVDKDLNGNAVTGKSILCDDCTYYDANPAWVIEEMLTNSDVGLGVSPTLIDSTSFENARVALLAEKFGLSPVMNPGVTKNDFIADITRHIDGSLVLSPVTGLFQLKLARDDYTPATLDIIGEDIITEVTDFAKPDVNTLVNQVTVVYTDRLTNNKLSVTAQNIAGLANTGRVNSITIEYLAVCSKKLATQIAERELRERGQPVYSCTIVGDRNLLSYTINDVFKLSWPNYGLDESIVRVTSVNYGNTPNGKIEMTVIQDVFGISSTVFTASTAVTATTSSSM